MRCKLKARLKGIAFFVLSGWLDDLAQKYTGVVPGLSKRRVKIWLCPSVLVGLNLVPRAFSSFKMADRRNLWPKLPKWLQNFVIILARKHDKISSSRLNNGFRLQKTNRAARRWKQPPKKPFHHVLRDKILHDSWSISAALARGVPQSAILNEEKALGTRLRST